MMSFRTLRSSLAASVILTVGASLPFQPWADSRSGASFLELDLRSDVSGISALYCGRGSEVDRDVPTVQTIAGGIAEQLRFALPAGPLSSLEWVLLDRDVRMTLQSARIVNAAGQTLEPIPLETFKPAGEIEQLSLEHGELAVSSTSNARQPRLKASLPEPLTLPRSNWWAGLLLPFIATFAATFSWDTLRPAAKAAMGQRLGALRQWAKASPVRAIALSSVLATLLANYPVIFSGKSFVSPGFGTALLYGSSPWVPGFQSIHQGNPNSADIDALMWQHVPYSMLEYDALFRDRELPLWNRFNSAGTPLLAQGQSGLGDPLHLLPLLANGAAWAWDLKFLLTKCLFSLGAGLCVWRLTRSVTATGLLAVSAQFIGFFVYRINHPAIFSLCYSPWIVYFWLRVAESSSVRRAVWALLGLLAANLAELCSGAVKEGDMLLLCLNFAGILILFGSHQTTRNKLRLLGLAAGQGVVFALVGAPVWYTFYRALKHAYTMYNAPQAFQLQPGLVIGLFDEVFYRPFQYFANVINPSANFFILLGVLWAGLNWRSLVAERRPVSALLIAGLLPLGLVYAVIPPRVVTRIPYLGNILHIDNTFSCVLIVLLTLIAGVGWKSALDGYRLRREAGGARSALLWLGVLYAVYLGTAQAIVRGYYAPQTWGALITVARFVHLYGLSLLAAAMLLLWALGRWSRRGTASAGLVVMAAVGFAGLHWRHGLQASSAFPGYVIVPEPRVDLRAESATMDFLAANRREPERSVGFVDNFFPGWSGAYGVEGICGADSLINPYYRELVDASGMERVWDWRYKLEDRDLPTVQPVLDLLNVRYYLDYPAGERNSRPGLRRLPAHDMEAYESTTVWPRAYFTDRVAVYRDLAQYVSWIRGAHGVPFAAMQDNDWGRMHPAPAVSGEIQGRVVRNAEDYQLTNNTTSFKVTATAPGFIVLGEAFEVDNFRATLNGAEVPYFRMNHCLKGIYVDAPGTYSVTFAYWPRGLSTSLLVCGIGLGVVLAEILLALNLSSDASPGGWQAI